MYENIIAIISKKDKNIYVTINFIVQSIIKQGFKITVSFPEK